MANTTVNDRMYKGACCTGGVVSSTGETQMCEHCGGHIEMVEQEELSYSIYQTIIKVRENLWVRKQDRRVSDEIDGKVSDMVWRRPTMDENIEACKAIEAKEKAEESTDRYDQGCRCVTPNTMGGTDCHNCGGMVQ